MLRSLAYTVAVIASFGTFIYFATHHVLADEARVATSERNIAELRHDVDELRERVDAPPTPPTPPTAPSRPGEPDADKVYAVPIGASPARGPADAWVTIVEFADYQCPFCARVEATLAEVRERYGDDVRIVFKHQPLPFHTDALDAAIAVECAGEQGLFWPLHDALYAQQAKLRESHASGIADGLPGLEWSRFSTCIAGQGARTRIAEDQRLGERFGARGTPSFFVNGKTLVGAQPLEAFATRIDAALAEAKASGVPRAEYYRRAVLEKGAPGL